MMNTRIAASLALALSLAGLAAGKLAPNLIASEASAYTIIAQGLHNPRGLTFGPGDRLFVAEAGLGGNEVNPVSNTGAIDEIVNPQSGHARVQPIVSGIASTGEGGSVVGVAGISAQGNGGIYAIMSESEEAIGNPAFGRLLKVTMSGNGKVVANVGRASYEWTEQHPELDPHDEFPAADPYGVLALPGRTFVVDAAANTLNEVRSNGQLSVLAYFENNISSDSTPTSIAQGPDGALYVGTLSLLDSFAFGPSAKIYRVDPARLPGGAAVPILGKANEWATGLWPIHGLAFGPDGTLYVSELITGPSFSGGDIVKIPFAQPSTHISLTGQMLPFPGGVAVSRNGTVYAVGLSVSGTDGFVARLNTR